MKHKDQEVPGNVLATAALTERILSKTGHSVHMAGHAMSNMEQNGLSILRISFKATGSVDGSWLAIISASSENGSVVAFHSGDSFPSTLQGVCSRIVNGSLKWKEDEYA